MFLKKNVFQLFMNRSFLGVTLLLFSGTIFPGTSNSNSNFKFRNKSSMIKLNKNSNFVVDSQIDNFKGTIIKQPGAYIDGEEIAFNEGVFQCENNKARMTGSYKPGTKDNDSTKNKIYLSLWR